MNRTLQKHLDNITVDSVMEFKREAFCLYANANGISLGVDGYGQFVVKSITETFKFNNPAIAIEKYTELVSNLT